MASTQISSGTIYAPSRQGLYSINTAGRGNIFISFDGNASASTRVYDSSLRELGSAPYQTPFEWRGGELLIDVSFNGSVRSITAYIPSYESYAALPLVGTGTYTSSNYTHLYKLMLKETSTALITVSEGYLSIYDEHLNYISPSSQAPISLAAGNYIIIAHYPSTRARELRVNVFNDSAVTDMRDYAWLRDIHLLDKNNTLYGADGNESVDIVSGGPGNDRFIGRMNDAVSNADRFFGGDGIDTSIYLGPIADYTIAHTIFPVNPWLAADVCVSGWQIEDSAYRRDGKDLLFQVERLEFSDAKLALDLDGNAGLVAKILAAVFGVEAVANKEYVGIGLGLLDDGMSYTGLAAMAVQIAGGNSREAVVNLLWRNLMGSAPTPEQAQPFIEYLKPDLSNMGDLAAMAADHAALVGVVDIPGLAVSGLLYT